LHPKESDEETDLVFFGRRYYHPILGRFITRDPEGFEDGPNLYAYLRNNPLTDFDLYGLFSWRNMWGGTRDFFGGAWDHTRGGISGIGYGIGKMGEWMHADFQYEHFNDRSFFQNKSYRATEGWKNLGRAAWNDPLGMVVPGVMEAWRNPTSPRAWGKAAVDIGVIGLSATKFGRAASEVGRARRIGEELATFAKTENAIKSNLSRHSTFNLTPEQFFSSKTYFEAEKLFTGKFGQPKGVGPSNKSFYNSKTGRTFNLHWDPLHRDGKPHVDIRKRGLPSCYYKDKPFFLKEE
jgi:RHS repeat-associated protein